MILDNCKENINLNAGSEAQILLKLMRPQKGTQVSKPGAKNLCAFQEIFIYFPCYSSVMSEKHFLH